MTPPSNSSAGVNRPLRPCRLWLVIGLVLALVSDLRAVSYLGESASPTKKQIDQLFRGHATGARMAEAGPTVLELRRNPEYYIALLEAALRTGSMARISSVAAALRAAGVDKASVRAFHAVFLASQGKLAEGRKELDGLPAAASEELVALFAKAMILRLEGRLEESLLVAKKALAMDESHPYAWHVLGRIHFESAEYKQAAECFHKTTLTQPRFLPGHANLGAALLAQGDYAGATGHFQKSLEVLPQQFEAHFGLALVHETTGAPAPALEEVRKCLAHDPKSLVALKKQAALELQLGLGEQAAKSAARLDELGDPSASIVKADAALQLGDSAKARRLLADAPADDPATHYVSGFCHLVNGNYDDALREMERVLELAPSHFGAHAARSALRFVLKQPAITIDAQPWGPTLARLLHFQAAIEGLARGERDTAWRNLVAAQGLLSGLRFDGLDGKVLESQIPREALADLNLALLCSLKRLPAATLTHAERSVAASSDAFLTNYCAAVLCLEVGMEEKGRHFLSRTLELVPTCYPALTAMGELEMIRGDATSARQRFERALRIKEEPGVHLRLGLLAEAANQNDVAAGHYEKFIALAPELFVGYNQLAWLYARHGRRLDEALRLAQRADALQPENAGILDTIGWIYFQQGAKEKSLECLLRAHQIDPSNPTIAFHLATLYAQTGESKTAIQLLSNALTASKKFDELDQARALLQRLQPSAQDRPGSSR